MRKTFKLSIMLLILLFMAGTAHAAPATWVDNITWDDVYFSDTWQTEIYTHDITQNNVSGGNFVVGQDVVNSYDLSIGLYDDEDSDGSEWAWINLPGLWTDALVEIEIDYEDIELGFSLQGLASLNTTGTLEVSITRLWGDFYLGSSTLTAHGETGSPVPIPGSVLLLGTGLIGLIGFRRRKIYNQ